MAEQDRIRWCIVYTKAADKFFHLHEDVREEYESAVRELLVGDHPERVDVKRIKGNRNDYYRIRTGKWRVIYTIAGGQIVVVTALLAGSRGDIYKQIH